jgi:hypothetical protein
MTDKGIVRGGLDTLSRIRLQGIALLCVAFLTGLLTGVAGERLLLSRRGRFGPLPRPAGAFGIQPGPPRGFPPDLDALGLSDAQRKRIDEIFSSRRPQTDSMLRAMMPRLRAAADSARQAIRAVLTPEQRARLDSLEAQPWRRGAMGRGPMPGWEPALPR